MGATLSHDKPPIKIAGTWRTAGKGPHDDVEVRVAYSLLHIEALLRFMQGVELTQLRVTRYDDGYLAMVKGTRGRKKVVCFFSAASWRDVLTLLATSLDLGLGGWQPDKPPKKRVATPSDRPPIPLF